MSSLNLTGEITRIGGSARLVSRTEQVAGMKAPEPATPEALPYGHPASAVVIRTTPSERQFAVDVSGSAKEWITAEIERVHRSLSPEHETGGWLYAAQRPRRSWDHLTIALATTSPGTRHARGSLTFGRGAFDLAQDFPTELAHLQGNWTGDWHCHPNRGGTIPSDRDAGAWAASMDSVGLERYVGLIVSPSESLGWLSPIFTAWTVRREGVPSVPICEPATLDW